MFGADPATQGPGHSRSMGRRSLLIQELSRKFPFYVAGSVRVSDPLFATVSSSDPADDPAAFDPNGL